MDKAYRVDLEELRAFFDAHEVVGASAKTADGTQIKRLVRVGDEYEVRRRYLVPGDGWESVTKWEGITSGTLEEVVAAYNRLS